jgi:hypothetical protein
MQLLNSCHYTARAPTSTQTLEHFTYCARIGRYSVPVSFFLLLTANDFFLVFNSSVNFVIYCCVGKEFRYRVIRLFLRRKRVNGGGMVVGGATTAGYN